MLVRNAEIGVSALYLTGALRAAGECIHPTTLYMPYVYHYNDSELI